MSEQPGKSAAPDPQAIAASFAADATLPCAEWVRVLDRTVAFLTQRREQAQAKVRRRSLIRGLAVVAVAGAGIACAMAVGPLGLVLGAIGALAVFFVYKIPDVEEVPAERVVFVRALAAAFAEADAAARLAIRAQFDYRRGLPRDAAGGEGRVDAWFEGRLEGVPGLRLAWRIVELPAVRFEIRRKKKRAARTRFMMRVVRQFAVRMDARRDCYRVAPAAANDLDVRQSENWISLRVKLRQSHKIKLRLGADIPDAIRTVRAMGRSEFFAPRAAEMIDLMKRCEQQLAPAGAKQ